MRLRAERRRRRHRRRTARLASPNTAALLMYFVSDATATQRNPAPRLQAGKDRPTS